MALLGNNNFLSSLSQAGKLFLSLVKYWWRNTILQFRFKLNQTDTELFIFPVFIVKQIEEHYRDWKIARLRSADISKTARSIWKQFIVNKFEKLYPLPINILVNISAKANSLYNSTRPVQNTEFTSHFGKCASENCSTFKDFFYILLDFPY